jgi:hypothetical protein
MWSHYITFIWNQCRLHLLKQDLQNTVINFTSQGLDIIKKWSVINIKLLTKDRCNNILQKVLRILDGLCRHQNMNASLTYKNLLCLKLCIYDIDQIINYFELTPEEIILTASKIITKTLMKNITSQSLNPSTQYHRIQSPINTRSNTYICLIKQTHPTPTLTSTHNKEQSHTPLWTYRQINHKLLEEKTRQNQQNY